MRTYFTIYNTLHWLGIDWFTSCVEDERTGDISFPNFGFRSATWCHFWKFNILKVVADIKKLFTSHKNLGKLSTSGVGFKWLSSLCSKWQHFEKKRAKTRFLALANQAIFWKSPQTTWLWQSAVTKPLQLQNIMAYPWKDNAHIFHLAPSFYRLPQVKPVYKGPASFLLWWWHFCLNSILKHVKAF